MTAWLLLFWMSGYDSRLVNMGKYETHQQCDAMAQRIKDTVNDGGLLHQWYCIEVPQQ